MTSIICDRCGATANTKVNCKLITTDVYQQYEKGRDNDLCQRCAGQLKLWMKDLSLIIDTTQNTKATKANELRLL